MVNAADGASQFSNRNPSFVHPFANWRECVCILYGRFRLFEIRGNKKNVVDFPKAEGKKKLEMQGIEPRASRMQSERSTI